MAMVEASGSSRLRHRLKVFIVKKISTEKGSAHPVLVGRKTRRALDIAYRIRLRRAEFFALPHSPFDPKDAD